MKRELEAQSGQIETKVARATILAILLCVSGTTAHAQKRSGPSPHSSKYRSSPSPTSTVTPPSITTQPASVTVLTGAPVSYSVAATGTAPLAYQWYENGTAIGGATSSTYTISATTTSYNGMQFTAVVSNSAGVILSPGQTATLSATFAPATAGSESGGITVTSNASNSPTVIALSGTGVAPAAYSVSLSWVPSTSSVAGYNVYSSSVSGGPYNKLTSSPVATTNYTDTSASAAQTYYYVVTAVSSTNVESAYSTQVSATVP